MNTLVVFATLLACTMGQIVDPPPTVDELELELYQGRWINTHSNSVPLGTYLKDGVCGSATYKICDNETIGVYNSQKILDPVDGVEDFLTGVALLTEEPGKLRLFLDGIPEGQYWVMKTGPVRNYEVVNEQGEPELRDLYSYSLVTDSRRVTLFVLCRDVNEFYAEFEPEVMEFLENNGFSTALNRAIEIYQGDDCVYPDPNPDFTC